jgi:uncharacterized repeat protein (TIGR03943 family)
MEFFKKENFLRLCVFIAWLFFFFVPLITGHLPIFIKITYIPLVILAIIILLILIVIQFKNFKRAESVETTFIQKISYVFFLFPVFLLIVVRPGSLSTFAASQFGMNTEFEGSPEELREIMESRAEAYGKYRRLDIKQILILQGKDPAKIDGVYVAVEGLIHEDGGTFFLVRYLITCCVAHARPLALEISCGSEPNPPQNKWVQARGQIIVEGGKLRIKVDRILEVPQPSNPYFY